MSEELTHADWLYLAIGLAATVWLIALKVVSHRTARQAPDTLQRTTAPPVHSLTPPSPAHLPVLSFEALIERTGVAGRITKIREKLAFTQDQFQRDVHPVLRALTEFIQLLPASESHHHAQPGGLLLHMLEVAEFALHFREAYKLPLGARTEEQLRLSAHYSYAVFIAALLHDMGKPVADVRVELISDNSTDKRTWVALAGSMGQQQGTWYKVDFREGRNYAAHQRLPAILLQKFIPTHALIWLGEYPPLLQELLDYLSGDKNGGAIAEIVKKADSRSVADNLASGPRTRFASARAVPLIERLMDALRGALAAGEVPINRAGAIGYCDGESLWCVAGSIAKAVRAYLEKHEQRFADAAGIPDDNARLFDTWQEYGALIPNPSSGAIWNIRVTLGNWEQAFTVLRFPLARLYRSTDHYPASLPPTAISIASEPFTATPQPSASETILTTAGRPSESAEPTNQPCADAANDILTADSAAEALSDVTAVTTSLPKLVPTIKEAHPTVPVEQCQTSAEAAFTYPSSDDTGDTHLEFDHPELLDEDDSALAVLDPAPSVLTAALPSAPVAPVKPKQREMKPPADSLAKRANTSKARPHAERFLAWIQQGIADGSIPYNEAGAFVHFVPKGMLLVSPKAFKEYAAQFEAMIEQDERPTAKEPWQLVQRDFQRSRFALKAEGGSFMHYYHVSGPGGKQLIGQLVPNPERLFSQIPPVNPLVQSKAINKIEHALSIR